MDRQVSPNCVGPEQIAPEGAVLIRTVSTQNGSVSTLFTHLLDALLYVKSTLLKFEDNYSNYSGVHIFLIFAVP